MTINGVWPPQIWGETQFIAIFGRRFLAELKVKQQPDERGYHVLTLLKPYMRGDQLERLQLEGFCHR